MVAARISWFKGRRDDTTSFILRNSGEGAGSECRIIASPLNVLNNLQGAATVEAESSDDRYRGRRITSRTISMQPNSQAICTQATILACLQ